mmetsp:Transcript_51963/g.137481  ORF Transcript_51963/g.137481 Transcript_51963/m.137481 type:complete len:298 (-) Transcript_51963:372-1265(-)
MLSVPSPGVTPSTLIRAAADSPNPSAAPAPSTNFAASATCGPATSTYLCRTVNRPQIGRNSGPSLDATTVEADKAVLGVRPGCGSAKSSAASKPTNLKSSSKRRDLIPRIIQVMGDMRTSSIQEVQHSMSRDKVTSSRSNPSSGIASPPLRLTSQSNRLIPRSSGSSGAPFAGFFGFFLGFFFDLASRLASSCWDGRKTPKRRAPTTTSDAKNSHLSGTWSMGQTWEAFGGCANRKTICGQVNSRFTARTPALLTSAIARPTTAGSLDATTSKDTLSDPAMVSFTPYFASKVTDQET